MCIPMCLQEYVSRRNTGKLRSECSKRNSGINFKGNVNVLFVLQ